MGNRIVQVYKRDSFSPVISVGAFFASSSFTTGLTAQSGTNRVNVSLGSLAQYRFTIAIEVDRVADLNLGKLSSKALSRQTSAEELVRGITQFAKSIS